MNPYRNEAHVQPITQHRSSAPSPLVLRLQTAAAIGIATWTVLFLFGLIIASLIHGQPTWYDARISATVAALIATITSSLLVIYWSFVTVQRTWYIDNKARKREQELEDETRAQTREQARDDQQTIQNRDVTLDRIPIVAWQILSRYVADKPTTRDAMIADAACSQAEWNTANRALIELGIKTRRKWLAEPDLMNLWHNWTTRIVIDSGRIWVLNDQGHSPHPLP